MSLNYNLSRNSCSFTLVQNLARLFITEATALSVSMLRSKAYLLTKIRVNSLGPQKSSEIIKSFLLTYWSEIHSVDIYQHEMEAFFILFPENINIWQKP